MFGPGTLSLDTIPTLLRQGGIGEQQTLIGGLYSIYLDGASDRIQGNALTDTWLKVMGPSRSFSLSFDIKVLELPMTVTFSGTSTDYFWIHLNADADLTVSRYRPAGLMIHPCGLFDIYLLITLLKNILFKW